MIDMQVTVTLFQLAASDVANQVTNAGIVLITIFAPNVKTNSPKQKISQALPTRQVNCSI